MTKHRFAIIGTSCAGKTTLTHAVIARLKSYGILADGVFSQDRKFSFPIDSIESEEAQNWMISNLIAKESDLYLHKDIEILVSDRSPLDLLAYYVYQHNTPLSDAAKRYAIEWCKGYTALYYLNPLPYQNDNKRPSDAFRLGVDKVLHDLMLEAEHAGVCVVRGLSRSDVLGDILRRSNRSKPSVKTALLPSDIQRLSNELGYPILAKFAGADADTLSDTDMWVVAPGAVRSGHTQYLADKARSALRGHVGPWPLFDIMVCSTAVGLPEKAQLFSPEATPPLLLNGDAFVGVEQEGPLQGLPTLFVRGLSSFPAVAKAVAEYRAEQVYLGAARLSEYSVPLVQKLLVVTTAIVTVEMGRYDSDAQALLDLIGKLAPETLRRLHVVITPVMTTEIDAVYHCDTQGAVRLYNALLKTPLSLLSVKHDVAGQVTYLTRALDGSVSMYTNTVNADYSKDQPVSL